jgi:hypothetical protein
MLRARGLRKRVADQIARATGKTNSRMPRQVSQYASDLRSLASDLEDRVTGRQTKRKEAAKKAAQTRKRNAAKRSTAAKKAAKTRAKAKS